MLVVLTASFSAALPLATAQAGCAEANPPYADALTRCAEAADKARRDADNQVRTVLCGNYGANLADCVTGWVCSGQSLGRCVEAWVDVQYWVDYILYHGESTAREALRAAQGAVDQVFP